MKERILTLAIFTAICLVSLSFIFKTAEAHAMNINAPTANDMFISGGIFLLQQAWFTYPNYVLGLSIVAFLSFCGACWSFYNITKDRKCEESPQQ